jgi:hypothetical protein
LICWADKLIHWVKPGDKANHPAVTARPNGSSHRQPCLHDPVHASVSDRGSDAGAVVVETPSRAPLERIGLFSLADADESVMPGFTSFEALRKEGCPSREEETEGEATESQARRF